MERGTVATTETGRPGREAELLSVRDVAALLNCSIRTVRRLNDAGRMPPPIRLGTLLRWQRSELLDWIKAGCPRAWRGPGR